MLIAVFLSVHRVVFLVVHRAVFLIVSVGVKHGFVLVAVLLVVL